MNDEKRTNEIRWIACYVASPITSIDSGDWEAETAIDDDEK